MTTVHVHEDLLPPHVQAWNNVKAWEGWHINLMVVWRIDVLLLWPKVKRCHSWLALGVYVHLRQKKNVLFSLFVFGLTLNIIFPTLLSLLSKRLAPSQTIIFSCSWYPLFIMDVRHVLVDVVFVHTYLCIKMHHVDIYKNCFHSYDVCTSFLSYVDN